MNDSDKQRLSDRLTKSYTESVKINNFNPHLVQLLENIKLIFVYNYAYN